jgi:predicted 2-oxoglutarate/Fe(II)-dependent dioxygenase YbiX
MLDRWQEELEGVDGSFDTTRPYPGRTLVNPPINLPVVANSIARSTLRALKWPLTVDPSYGYYYNYLEYSEGESLRKHVDVPPTADVSGKFKSPREVVLTIVIGLSRLDEYQGGELVLDNSTLMATKLGKGDIAIFYSQIPHRVTQVTQGRRKVLCCFLCGPVERSENAA